MSLLSSLNEPKILQLAQKIYAEQFIRDPKLENEYDDRRKKLMYEDILYNISFLMTAVHFSDEIIFTSYVRWLYDLLCNIMKDLDQDRIMTHMNDHYKILAEMIHELPEEIISKTEHLKAESYLKKAMEITQDAVVDVPLSDNFSNGEHAGYRKEYLKALLHNETKTAFEVIDNAKKDGLTISDIYENILKMVMQEVGKLWHNSKITVDKEHYCSSVTQTVMSRFYDDIFAQPRHERVLICCAVGSELHEIGGRMVSDLFEYDGWDTYYLGAAVPESALLHAVGEHQPDLIALSVTMPQHLLECERIVKAVRKNYPEVKIAVGGRAFEMTNKIWEQWPIDVYTTSATKLILWSREAFHLQYS